MVHPLQEQALHIAQDECVCGARGSRAAPIKRGGMMSQQEAEAETFDMPYVLDVNPLPIVADQERRVVILEGPQRDSLLSAQLQLEGHPSMLAISEAISRVTGVATYRLAFFCPDDSFRANPIPMWAVPSPHMVVKILPQEANTPRDGPAQCGGGVQCETHRSHLSTSTTSAFWW